MGVAWQGRWRYKIRADRNFYKDDWEEIKIYNHLRDRLAVQHRRIKKHNGTEAHQHSRIEVL